MAAASVTAPAAVEAVELVLIKAPLPSIPDPLKLSAFRTLKPFRSTVKPEPTVTVPVPKAPLVTEPAEPVDARPAMSLPPETVVPPE